MLSDTEVEATYAIPEDSALMRAHFTGLNIMPGVLIGEGLAQAGTLIVRYHLNSHPPTDILAFQIEKARFLTPALPGETLRFHVRLTRLRRQAARLEGEAHVGDRRVCKARLVLALIARESLRDSLGSLPGR